MKQREDTRTRDMLRSPGAQRQADYAAKQRQHGRSQRTFWLTDEEVQAVRGYIEQLRGAAE